MQQAATERKRSIQGSRRFFLAFFLLVWAAFPSYALPAGPPKVLVLHSYHKSFGWTDSIQQALNTVFQTERPDADLYVEYLNLKRTPPEKAYAALAALYQTTLAGVAFDCIICSDDAALDFLLLYRETLFKNTPVVFCGVNDYKPERISGQSGYTGVAETFDIPGTIEIGQRLFPLAKKAIVITDVTETGKINLHRARQHYAQFKNLEFVEFSELKAADLAKALSALGPDAFVLMFSYFRDPDGRTFSPKESLAFISQATTRPIFTFWDFYFGPGVVGGHIVSGAHQGQAAAHMVLRILQGERPEDIPVGASPNAYVFEHDALERFKIDKALLPAESVVLHEPDSLYMRYRYRIWAAVAAFFLQTITIVLLLRAIGARKKALQDLSDSETRFRQLADATWEGIVIHDNGVIVEANPQFYQLSGYTSAELAGKQVLDILLSEESAAFAHKQLAAGILTTGNLVPYELKGRNKAGDDIYVEIRTKRMNFYGRELRVAAVRDITNRKRAEFDREMINSQLEQLVEERTEDLNQKSQELEIANYELRKLDELKSTFLNTVSHDLRTPLTSIMGFIKLIRRDFLKNFIPASSNDPALEKKGQRIADNLAIIENESERLTRLINDLLDISRMEADQDKWRDAPVAPARVIEDAVNACKGALLEKPDVELLVEAAPDLPLLYADPDKLVQVLANLLGNAVKFTTKGHVAIYAERAPAETVRIRVVDTGEGIPSQDLPCIFDKFYQTGSDTLLEKPKGTGMGLAICKLIVEHYCGRIWAESELGQGSTFIVELPVLPPDGDRFPNET